MALLDASGTADASSMVSSDAAVRVARSLIFDGSTAFVGSAGLVQLTSATARGGSLFRWDYAALASATFAGAAVAEAAGSVRVEAKALARGSSRFFYNVPLEMTGASQLSVVPVVDRQLRPLRGITLGPKTFRWLQPLQRGDLSVLICDRHAPFGPYRVTYSLLQLRPDGSRRYVGVRDRVPASGGLGEFYATGRAGESGQPGQWVIEWRFQRSPDSAAQSVEMPFQVLDTVAGCVDLNGCPRKAKFGWS